MQDRLKSRVWDVRGKQYIYRGGIDMHLGKFMSMRTDDEDIFIVEQCTGLKDINGKLIYEGDLFKVFDDIISAEVIWDNKTASYKVKMLFNSDEWHMNYGGYYEDAISDLSDWLGTPIIGNIHENLELSNANV